MRKQYALKSGEIVRVVSSKSHPHKETLGGLEYAIRQIESDGRSFIIESVQVKDFKGKNHCVKVRKDDEIVHKTRKGRRYKTKFVIGREPVDSDIITVILKRYGAEYLIITSFVGPKAEKEVHDPNIQTPDERKVCEEFWNGADEDPDDLGHALVLDEEVYPLAE